MAVTTLRRLVGLAAVLAALVAAVPVRAADPLVVGETFLTAGLDPAKGSNGWALASHGVAENLFTVDRDGQVVPQLADAAERVDAATWRIHLVPGRLFSDGTPVSAESVAAALSRTVAASPVARTTGGMLTLRALDAATLSVTTERPVVAIRSMFAEWALAIYKLAPDGSFLFTGPYAVEAFKADASLSLVPNPHYPGAGDRRPVTIRKFGDGQTLALAFEAGGIDLAFGLPAAVLDGLKARTSLTVKSFPVGYQYMAWLNTRHALLSDVRVRQAIDLAFDRREMTAAIDGGTPATGAFAPYFPFAAAEPRPHDPAAAEALLAEAGWVRAAGGRTKDGAALALTVVAYLQRPDLVTLLPVVKAELSKLGIAVIARTTEAVNDVAAKGDFDILLWAQHTAPSGDPAFFLSSTLRSGASLNYSGYADLAFDAILDALDREADGDRRNGLAQQAQQRLFQTVPVSFLVSPSWHVGLSTRLPDYEPWGSDYHVLRADIGEVR